MSRITPMAIPVLAFFTAVATHSTAALAQETTAQDCLEEVRQIHATDLDPFKRPPHRSEMYVFSPDGTQSRILDTIWETPIAAISGIRGNSEYSLVIGPDIWMGPTADGPWAKLDYSLPEDRQTQLAQLNAEETANISDVTCPAMVSLDGTPYLAIGFRTQTNKDAGGNFFGALNAVYLDPDTRLPIRWDQTEFVNSWKPGVDMERQVTVFTYDPTIRMLRPD